MGLIISIHSLRVEGDSECDVLYIDDFLFQSTPSVWRETDDISAVYNVIAISIHSLRVEGDII